MFLKCCGEWSVVSLFAILSVGGGEVGRGGRVQL